MAMFLLLPTGAVNIALGNEVTTIDQSTTIDNAKVWREITLEYTLYPTDASPRYVLCTASNPRNRTGCFSSGMNNISTVEYFDTLCGEIIGQPEGKNEVYIRTYIEQITSGYSGDSNYRSGVRISCRIVFGSGVVSASNLKTHDIKWFSSVESYWTSSDGLEVNIEYDIVQLSDYNTGYIDGYQEGYSEMDASGLSATQTAFGVVSAPINAIAKVIQEASNGWFSTPVGELSAWVIGIVAIGIAVSALVKVVIG